MKFDHRIVSVATAMLVLSTFTAGCSRPTETAAASNGRTQIGVSIAPQAWLVGQIGGDRVQVVQVVPAASSPATYQPSDAQVSELMRCATYFQLHLPFERGAWFRALRSSNAIRIVDLQAGMDLREILAIME